MLDAVIVGITGAAKTVTLILLVVRGHPALLIVKVGVKFNEYVVVVVGFTEGFRAVVFERPVEGDQTAPSVISAGKHPTEFVVENGIPGQVAYDRGT